MSFRGYLGKSNVQNPGSRGGHPWWDGRQYRYGPHPTGNRGEGFKDWQRPVDHDIHKHLDEGEEAGGSGNNTWAHDRRDGSKYLVKRFRHGEDFRAMTENVGMALGRDYGVGTAGHTITGQNGTGPMLIQRAVNAAGTIADIFRKHQGTHGEWPDEETRVSILSHLTQKQVNEMFGNLIADYMTGNCDAHSDNFIVTNDGDLVGIDKGQTGKYLGHPHFRLEDPDIDESGYVSYTKRKNIPRGTAGRMGPVYAPVMTNVVRGKYKPDVGYIKGILSRIDAVDGRHDEQIRAASQRFADDNPYPDYAPPDPDEKLAQFQQRRKTVREDMTRLFARLGVDIT